MSDEPPDAASLDVVEFRFQRLVTVSGARII